MERRSEVLGRKVFKDLFVSASRFSKGETHTQSFSGSLSFHTECSIFLKDSSEETPKGRKGTAGRPFGGFFFLYVCCSKINFLCPNPKALAISHLDFKGRGE